MSGRRRSQGEGAVFQRASDGRWVGRVDVGYLNGKRKRVTVYGKTEREVLAKLREVNKAKDRGQDFTARTRTVAEWLTEWLDEIKATDGTRPQTIRWYRWLVKDHIVPTLGPIRLDRLTPANVRHLLAVLIKGGAGTVTVRQAHGLLRNALGDAERLDLLPRNVARSVRPPGANRQRRRALTPAEARQLLDAAAGERLYAFLVLAITTGLRRCEVLALRWSDVDFESGTLRVERTLLRLDGRLVFAPPKSERSTRTVPVPPLALAELREHEARQNAERDAAGTRWWNLDLVFPSSVGTAMEPTNVNRWFRDLRERAGLSWVRIHDLRHACATFMLNTGADLRTIMETLGHSQIGITADLYAHVLPPRQRTASDAAEAELFRVTSGDTDYDEDQDETDDQEDEDDDPDDGLAGVLVRR
jgi:integrase